MNTEDIENLPWWLLYSDDVNWVKLYLKHNPEKINMEYVYFFDTFTPMTFAIKNNRVDIIDALIELGCDVNYQDRTFKRTPLHFCCVNNNRSIIEKLIAAGANGNLTDVYQLTPLHLAAQYCTDSNIINLLIPLCNPNSTDKSGNTPLHICSFYNNNTDMLKSLIDVTYDINCKNNYNKTPLDFSSYNNEEYVKILLDKKGTYSIPNPGRFPQFIPIPNLINVNN